MSDGTKVAFPKEETKEERLRLEIEAHEKHKALVRKVYRRDGWRCRNPDCRSPRNLTPHHIVPKSRGGADTEDNLLTLCVYCHSAVHAHRMALVPDLVQGKPWYETVKFVKSVGKGGKVGPKVHNP